MSLGMQVILVIAAIVFISIMLYELGRSQKEKEEIEALPQDLRLEVDMRSIDGVAPQRLTYVADNADELQRFLNNINIHNIVRAGVFRGRVQLFVMKPSGILEGV